MPCLSWIPGLAETLWSYQKVLADFRETSLRHLCEQHSSCIHWALNCCSLSREPVQVPSWIQDPFNPSQAEFISVLFVCFGFFFSFLHSCGIFEGENLSKTAAPEGMCKTQVPTGKGSLQPDQQTQRAEQKCHWEMSLRCDHDKNFIICYNSRVAQHCCIKAEWEHREGPVKGCWNHLCICVKFVSLCPGSSSTLWSKGDYLL